MAGTDILQGKILFHLERLQHLEIFSNGNGILFLLIPTGTVPSQFPSFSGLSHLSRRDPWSRMREQWRGIQPSHPGGWRAVQAVTMGTAHGNTYFHVENGGQDIQWDLFWTEEP